MQLILSFDIGTSGTKTTLVRRDGTILGSASCPHKTRFGEGNRAEQEPSDWWEGVCRSTAVLLEKHPEAAENIEVIGVSGHMTGCVPVDRSGRAVYSAIIHSDTRSSEQHEYVLRNMGAKVLYSMTGNIPDPRSSLCKILWLKQCEPDIYNRTAKFLQSKDYIVSCLTGNIDTTDFSDASHGQLMDICKKEYDRGMLKELGIDSAKLPALRPGTDIAGRLSSSSAKLLGLKEGIMVSVGGGDGACANVGAGVTVPGDIYCCLGTTAWIACSASQPLIDPGMRVFNMTSVDGESCGVFGTVQSAGSSVKWAGEVFDEPDAKGFDSIAATVPPGCDGLIFLPYLEGERSPIFDPAARGVFFGLNSRHTKRHMLRAVLEGVAFALRNVLDVYRELWEIDSMRIIGGGAASALWRDIISSVCDVSLAALSVPSGDATSLGAAIAAGVGAGLYRDIREGTGCIGVISREFPQKEQSDAYKQTYEIYKSLYPQLKQAFSRLSGIGPGLENK